MAAQRLIKLNGVDTDQFVYRGPDLDWQVWIARGRAPLPQRIVISRRSDPARPAYAADLVWNTSPTFTDASFAFRRDAKSSSIQLAQVGKEQ